MSEYVTIQQIDDAAAYIRSKVSRLPKIGMILGSGLGGLADSIEDAVIVPYGEIPHWPVSTVVGHSGRLVLGKLEGRDVLVMQGRVHYYEGYPIQQVTFPVRVMDRLGIETLVVTNAAGAINQSFEAGDLMLITDQINMVGMAGQSPLRGPNMEEFGTRFPDMSQAYDREYHQLARDAAKEAGFTMREGVYVGLVGPAFETPAEVRFLHIAGADAVGMSTVHEVTVARHGEIRVLGISGLTNKHNLDGLTKTTHEEVFEAGIVIAPRLVSVVRGFLRRLD